VVRTSPAGLFRSVKASARPRGILLPIFGHEICMKLAGSFANAGTRQLLDASSLSRGEIHRENLRFQMTIPRRNRSSPRRRALVPANSERGFSEASRLFVDFTRWRRTCFTTKQPCCIALSVFQCQLRPSRPLGASIPLPRGSSGQVLRLFRSAKEEKRIAEGGEKNHTDPRWRGKESDRCPRAVRREGDKFPAS